MPDSCTPRNERRTGRIFRVEDSPSTCDYMLARTTITELSAFAAAHRIDYMFRLEANFGAVVKRDDCTFSVRSKDGGERDTTASLDDLVTLIDPWPNDLLKRRNFGANRLTTLYTTTIQYVPFPCVKGSPRGSPVHYYSTLH